MTRHLRVPGLAALPLVALLTSGCVINLDADQVVVKDEKAFKVGQNADLTLETFDGSVQVASWDRPEVVVEIQKRGPDRETAAALDVTASQDGDRIRVDAPMPKVVRHVIGIGSSSPSVSFIAHVPKHLTLTVHTRDGFITVGNVDGVVDLRSGDGSIKGDGISGELRARTDDGSMRIENVNGRVSIESGDGSLHISGRVDDLHARTRDGSIVIEADEGSSMKKDWDVTTGDGSITFRVPKDFSAEIDANSRDGSVSGEGAGVQSSSDGRDRETLRGRLGSGGHTVRLRSGDGSIRVLNR